VPHKFKEDPSLSGWVETQRNLFKNGIMNQERKARLEEIGFIFFALNNIWNLQFKKLRHFYVKHGHCELIWAVDCFTFIWNTPTNT
jgi:hypothetical protein